MREELQYDKGRVSTLSLGEYKIPTMSDLHGAAHRARCPLRKYTRRLAGQARSGVGVVA